MVLRHLVAELPVVVVAEVAVDFLLFDAVACCFQQIRPQKVSSVGLELERDTILTSQNLN